MSPTMSESTGANLPDAIAASVVTTVAIRVDRNTGSAITRLTAPR
jgi:hypothetical protein